MNTICLTDDEAKRLAQLKSGDRFLIVRIVKDHSSDRLNCSYAVGQEIGVRETWDGGYAYDGDTPTDIEVKSEGGYPIWHWRSPATMPKEAITKHLILGGINCKRVQRLTYIEIESMGHEIYIDGYGEPEDSSFRQYWNSIHAKPRKQGDIYVVYLYF